MFRPSDSPTFEIQALPSDLQSRLTYFWPACDALPFASLSFVGGVIKEPPRMSWEPHIVRGVTEILIDGFFPENIFLTIAFPHKGSCARLPCNRCGLLSTRSLRRGICLGLLIILSQGSDPLSMNDHYEKVFDAISHVHHNKNDKQVFIWWTKRDSYAW